LGTATPVPPTEYVDDVVVPFSNPPLTTTCVGIEVGAADELGAAVGEAEEFGEADELGDALGEGDELGAADGDAVALGDGLGLGATRTPPEYTAR
jgi:hypothetical protein